ncbi:MAG: extracellular solute-binding protein [Clostridiales bacterium]|jgi:arabinogalactan oligomer/maltooligosaccharide transport system substrate-binding protein|nr:extracellular solute-binding protein [Clostridiales bacterium]
MKRTFVAVVAALMITTPLSACSGNAANGGQPNINGGSEPVKLTIWHDKEDAVVAALQAELDKLKPDIIVTLEKKNGLTEALKMVGNDPKAAPDMYFFAHDKLGVYAEMGILTPITEFVSAETLGGFLPMTTQAAMYKGEIYQLPIYFETLLFMYNRALMPDSSVPTTTEGLLAFMKDVTGGGQYGFVEQHSTAYYSAGWIHGFGGEIISNDGVPQLNGDKTVAALEYHLKFARLMTGESEYATVNTLFKEGKAAATIGGPWLVPTAREAGIDLGLAKMPVINETGLPIAPYSGVQGLHVLKVSAGNPEKNTAIKKVLNQLCNTDIGAAMASASGCAPAFTACYELESVKTDDMVMMMSEVAENAVPMPNIPEMDVMWNVASNMLVDINMRKADVRASADKAQKQAEDLIKSMK